MNDGTRRTVKLVLAAVALAAVGFRAELAAAVEAGQLELTQGWVLTRMVLGAVATVAGGMVAALDTTVVGARATG